jgi:hypothetical protein
MHIFSNLKRKILRHLFRDAEIALFRIFEVFIDDLRLEIIETIKESKINVDIQTALILNIDMLIQNQKSNLKDRIKISGEEHSNLDDVSVEEAMKQLKDSGVI